MVLSTPVLSFLIPVYNTADYLEECLESILSQTPKNIEIVIYNDGSSDGSDQICMSFAKRYPDIVRYYPQTINQGISVARNFLTAHAKGEYIWFVDSDDFLLPGSIETIAAIIKENDADMVICDYLKDNKKHKKSFHGNGGTLSYDRCALIAGIFKHFRLFLWQKIIKKSVFDNIELFPEGHFFEDIHLIPHILIQVKSYYYLPKPLVSYRIRAGSIVDNIRRPCVYFKAMNSDRILALQQIKILLDDKDINESCRFWMSNFVARQYIDVSKVHTPDDDPAHTLAVYRQDIEASSPLNFSKLLRRYLVKGRIKMWFRLIFATRRALPK